MYLLTIDNKRILDLVHSLKKNDEICYFNKSTFSLENLKIRLLSYIRQGKRASNILIILHDIPSINLDRQIIKYLKDLSTYFHIIFAYSYALKNTKTHFNSFTYDDDISNSNQFVFKKEIDLLFFSKFFQNLKTSVNTDHNCIYRLKTNILDAIFSENDIQIVKSILSILLIKSYNYVKIKSIFNRLKLSYPNSKEEHFSIIINQLKNFLFQIDSEEKYVKIFDPNFFEWMKNNNYLNEKEGYQIEALYNWSKICNNRFAPNRSSTPLNSSIDLSRSGLENINLSQIQFDNHSSFFFEKWRHQKWLKKHRFFLKKSFGYNDNICFSKMLLIHDLAKEQKYQIENKSIIFDDSISLSEYSATEQDTSLFNIKSKSCLGNFFLKIFSFFKK